MFGRIKAIPFLLIGSWALIWGIWVGMTELANGIATGDWHFTSFAEYAHVTLTHNGSSIFQRPFELLFQTPGAIIAIVIGSLLLRSGFELLTARP